MGSSERHFSSDFLPESTRRLASFLLESSIESSHRMGRAGGSQERMLSELQAIRARIAHLPELESRTDEEIVGYDEHGIPN